MSPFFACSLADILACHNQRPSPLWFFATRCDKAVVSHPDKFSFGMIPSKAFPLLHTTPSLLTCPFFASTRPAAFRCIIWAAAPVRCLPSQKEFPPPNVLFPSPRVPFPFDAIPLVEWGTPSRNSDYPLISSVFCYMCVFPIKTQADSQY